MALLGPVDLVDRDTPGPVTQSLSVQRAYARDERPVPFAGQTVDRSSKCCMLLRHTDNSQDSPTQPALRTVQSCITCSSSVHARANKLIASPTCAPAGLLGCWAALSLLRQRHRSRQAAAYSVSLKFRSRTAADCSSAHHGQRSDGPTALWQPIWHLPLQFWC